jgi:Mlc titration factor MtfA (ptsG expression regulator)
MNPIVAINTRILWSGVPTPELEEALIDQIEAVHQFETDDEILDAYEAVLPADVFAPHSLSFRLEMRLLNERLDAWLHPLWQLGRIEED